MKKNMAKRIIASILSMAMVTPLFPTVFAADDVQDEALVNELLSYQDTYPDGAFAFREAQLQAEEDSGTTYIDVVRYGSFEGDASVTFKAVDVSAEYGKDYTITVEDGWFLSHELEQDEEAVPLMDLYTDATEEVVIGEDAVDEEADDQVVQMALDAQSGELSVNNKVAESVSEEEETGLRAARNAYIGNESDRKAWQEITGTDNEQVADAQSDMENVPDYVGEFADGLLGSEYEIKFKDGEYLKRIRIDLVDDDLSETDEQVMFVVYAPENAEIAKPQSAYLNIIDTDENEPVVFYIDEENVIASPAEGYATVTVKRSSGLEKFASVTVGTGAIDAQPDVDYKSGSVDVIFPQGVDERTVQIPLYNSMRKEAVSFAVAIDKETAFVDEERYGTLVTILPDYSEESMALYSDVLADLGEEGKSVEVYMPSSEEDGGVRLMSNSDTVTSGFVTSSQISPKNPSTDYSAYVTALKGLDLRNASRIEISYKLSGWYSNTYSYKDGCDTKTKTDKYYDAQAQFKVGSKTATASGSSDPTSGTVSLTGFSRKKNQSIEFQVRKSKWGSDNDHWVTCTINKIVIVYDDITLTVDNTAYDTNRYVEKIYSAGNVSTDQGMGYRNGNTMKLGDGFASGDATNVKVNRFTSPISLNVKDSSGQKTSQGIVPKIGTNVYLAGWQFYDSHHNKYVSDIIKPDDMTMETIYSYELKASGNSETDKTSFQVRPVLKPYPSMIKFNNAQAGSLAYTNNVSDGKEIGVRMLDTINLEAIPVNNSGRAVDTFVINGYLDKEAHSSTGSKRSNLVATLEGYAYGTKDSEKTNKSTYLSSHARATDNVLTEFNSADSNKIVIKPNCEAINIDMTYTTPKIDVRYNPSRSAPTTYKDQGVVAYVDSDTQTSLKGDYASPMTIQPVDYGHIFNINALYKDTDETKTISDYKTTWQDFTGDLDGNGELSTAEVEALARYGLDRAPATGDTFNYQPRVTNSQIYYYFTKRERVQGAGGIYGVVELKDYPIFGGKGATYTPINGATVTVDGMDTVTAYDSDFGGDKGLGGDGYFYFSDKTFVAGESHRVTVQYGSLSTSAVHHVNVAQKYVLDAYDTISVVSASRIKGKDAMGATQPILNDDANYTLVFGTVSSVSAKVATKAKLRFYRKDKTFIAEKEYNSTGANTGVFNCEFNPKTLNVPAGATVTVQFTDNEGVEYFEHDTGILFMQSLGAMSFISSFSGGAHDTFKVIGQIGALFGFGWDGNLDDTSGKLGDDAGEYSLVTTEEKKVLTLSLKFDKKGKIGDKDKDKDKEKEGDKEGDKDKEDDDWVIVTDEDIKEAAKSEDESKTKDTAKKVDEGKKKNESKLTTSYKLAFTFGLTLTLTAADDPEHLGEWRFDEFMIVINAGASLKFSTTYVTPIGVPLTFSLTVGADATAIIVVERVLGTSYYMTDLLGDDSGTINLIKQGQSLGDYMYVYGKFTVSPFIEIAVKVGWTGFNAELSGRATLKFNYDMKEASFTGSVNFKCKLTIEVLLFTKTWTLADKTIDLFGAGPELYESLDEFEVSDRENLKYRTSWNGGGGPKLMAVAGLYEEDLMGGVNPNADIRIMPLDDGKYIAVFVDDAEERSENNSLAVFYSIYDGSAWSKPQIIEDDGTIDDTPAVMDVGDGRLFIAWSSANVVFADEPGVLQSLNAQNIHGVFIDKETQELSDVVEVTKNTGEDWAGDVNPHIAYDDSTKRMIVYYTKEEYKASANSLNDNGEHETDPDNPGVYGDAVYPYSVVAYRLYDIVNDEFIGYSDREKESIKADRIRTLKRIAERTNTEYIAPSDNELNEYLDQYISDYYNQRFLDLAPVVVNGSGNLVSGTNTNDPIVIETDAIGYNHLALFSYILDYDGDKSTTYDRDIYMQIYNFNEDSISYPIKLTDTGSNTDPEEERAKAQADGGVQTNTASKIHFERIGGKDGITYLAYLCDGEVRLINISENVSDNTVLTEQDVNGTKYYVIDKLSDNYRQEETLIGKNAGGDYTGEAKITDFDLRSNEKFFYTMFTESVTRAKDGIEDGTEEATKPENRVAESHIFMKRYDIDNGQFTNPVQVTEGEGMNYNNIAFVVEDDGFAALATRCASKIENVEGNDVVMADTANSTLCAITFKPDASVELRKGQIDNIVSGSDVYASFEVYNGGIDTIDGLTVEITDSNGNNLEPVYDIGVVNDHPQLSSYDEETNSISLIGGERQVVSMAIPVVKDGYKAGFTATVKDKDGQMLDTIDVSETAVQKIDVASFDAEIKERGKLTLNATLINNETVVSGGQTFRIVADEDKVLFEKNIESLDPEETVTISDTIDIDYSELFDEITNDDGSVTADLKLMATAGGENAEDVVSLYATKEQMARFNAVTDVNFGAGTNVRVAKNGVLNIEPTITAGDYVGGRIDDNNESEIEAQGVELKYVSSNENVVKVYENGFIIGERDGKAKVTAMLIPSDVEADGIDYTSRYATLPDKAIRLYDIDVTVGTGVAPSSGGGGGNSSPKVKINNSENGSASVSKTNPTKGETVTVSVTPKLGYELDKLVVADKYGNELDVTKNADGTYSYVQPADVVTITPKFRKIDGSGNGNETKWFLDVPESAWYYAPIKEAFDAGRMSGMNEDYFEPETDITRGMFAYAIYRREGFPETEANNKFEDVNDGSYYETAIAWATENGIVKGYDDTHYGPDDPITREQLTTIIYRYAQYKNADVSIGEDTNILDFDDALNVSEYAVSSIQWAIGAGVITGFEDRTLRPQANATRAQMAVILNKIADMF